VARSKRPVLYGRSHSLQPQRSLGFPVPVLPASPERAPATASPMAFRVALAVLALALFACVVGYLALSVPRAWFGGAPQMRWTARELSLARGTGGLKGDSLALTAPDATRTVVVSFATTLRAQDYPEIAWNVSGIPDGVEAALLWYNDYQPSRVFSRPLTVEAGRIAPANVAREAHWIGRIGGLALVLRGDFNEPIIVRWAAARPMTAMQVLGDRAHEWLAFEPWNGTSINTLTGGADAQDLPLPVLLAAVVALAALAYTGLARWQPAALAPARGAVIAAFFVAAWFVLDARWQLNLARQVERTQHQYAGKSWRERHLAAEDGPLFAFIEKVRAKLPAQPVRVFMVADANYFRDRGAYHLYPYNVFFTPWNDAIAPSSDVHSGDYLVVYLRRGVEYNAAAQSLRWDDYPPVKAELVLVDGGGSLFRIL
jgi:hypothetical protein